MRQAKEQLNSNMKQLKINLEYTLDLFNHNDLENLDNLENFLCFYPLMDVNNPTILKSQIGMLLSNLNNLCTLINNNSIDNSIFNTYFEEQLILLNSHNIELLVGLQ